MFLLPVPYPASLRDKARPGTESSSSPPPIDLGAAGSRSVPRRPLDTRRGNLLATDSTARSLVVHGK